MTRRILVVIAGLIVCAAAYAAGTSIWSASPRGTVSGTDRIPVATSGSSGPLYVTPVTIKNYIETFPTGLSLYGDGSDPGGLTIYGVYDGPGSSDYLQIVSDEAEGWMQIKAVGPVSTNVGIALQPAGTGALAAQVPDSSTTGGNARGVNAVDWQTPRSDAEMVASGQYATIGGGEDNTASGQRSTVSGGSEGTASGDYSAVPGGSGNTASGYGSVAMGSGGVASGINAGVLSGQNNTASGDTSVVSGGDGNVASGDGSWVPGGIGGDTLGVTNSYAYGGNFGQTFGVNIGAVLLGDTPIRLSSMQSIYSEITNTVIPSGYSATCVGIFTATDGVGAAGFECKGVAVNLSGTTTLVTGACASIGTPSASLSTATMSMQANDTDDTLEYVFTGVSETAVNVGGESKCSTMYVPD